MSRLNRLFTVAQATLLILVSSFATVEASAGTVRLGGTGSGLGIMKLLGDAYQARQPDTRIIIVPSLGSSGGIKAAAVGVLDIGLSGRLLKPSELGHGLTVREVGRSPLVVTSLRDHSGFTLTDLAGIFDGSLNRWPDGRVLRPVIRPESDSETALLRAISPELDRALTRARARPGVHVAITDQDSADAIEQIPGAVGTTTLGLIRAERRQLTALPLDGIVPSVATLASGRYPYSKPLYVVVPASISPATQGFLAFVQSPEGARIMRENGYLPVGSAE